MSNEEKTQDNVEVTKSNQQEAEDNQVLNSSTLLSDKDIKEIETSASVITADNETKNVQEENIEKENTQKQEIAVMSAADLEALNYTKFDTPAKMLVLAEVLIKSQLVPLKRKEDVVVAIMTGNRLGISFDVAVSQIYPINGKPTLGVHIIRGILLRQGIWFECVRNKENYYEFVEEQKEGEKSNFVVIAHGYLDEQPPNTKKKSIDVRTVYNFERDLKMPSGKFKTIKVQSYFGYNDAVTAGYFEKEVWTKQFPRMLDARAFTIGAKQIADDFLHNISSTDEMLDVKGETYIMNQDGSVTQV